MLPPTPIFHRQAEPIDAGGELTPRGVRADTPAGEVRKHRAAGQATPEACAPATAAGFAMPAAKPCPPPSVALLPPDAPMRLRLLVAAVELLQRDGFAGLTQTAVARLAGARQSHLTYYFPTRTALLRATVQFGMETVLGPIIGAAKLGQLTLEQYKALLLPTAEDRAWCRLMNEFGAACSEDPGIREWLAQFDAGVRERIREGFNALGVPATEEDILVLHMAYMGALHSDAMSLTDASLEGARRAVAHAMDVLVAAIRSRGRTSSPAGTRSRARRKGERCAP